MLRNYDELQFGFRPLSSTTSALIYLHDFITKHLDDPQLDGVEPIAYDFCKAFDKLNHDILLRRLCDLNNPPDLIYWLRNYLKDRFQRVRISAHHSELSSICSGVPQGSLLGPYLFCAFVSNLRAIHASNAIVKYADDSALISSIPSIDSDRQQLREEHESILNWSTTNKLPINIGKCCIIGFPKRPNFVPTILSNIKKTNVLKYLGTTLTSDLKLKTHVGLIVKRASRALHILRILKPFTPKTDLINVYNMLMRSILEYANPLFIGLPSTQHNRLLRVQKRAHKIICGSDCVLDCLGNLLQRRRNQSLSLFKKCLQSDHLLNCIIPPRAQSLRIQIPYSCSNRR